MIKLVEEFVEFDPLLEAVSFGNEGMVGSMEVLVEAAEHMHDAELVLGRGVERCWVVDDCN